MSASPFRPLAALMVSVSACSDASICLAASAVKPTLGG
jgi:hypothetical protein